jgi:hypothetical protein
MADNHEQPPRPPRAVPPPFAGPPRTGPLAPRTRADRLTLPPFSPPLATRTPPAAPVAPPSRSAAPAVPPRPPAPVHQSRVEEPAWLRAGPNEQSPVPESGADVGAEWRNPDEPTGSAPTQTATGIAWLDSPEPPPAPSTATSRDADDDPFGWGPAEERGTALDAPRTPSSLDALKETEPWALPGAEPPTTGEDVAAALERIAARIRSGDLLVVGAAGTASDEALLAAVLAALLQRARG